MKLTLQEANKLVHKFNDDIASIMCMEEQCREFLAAMGENIESVRPKYSYVETQAKIEILEAKIRKVKHEINAFNTTYEVRGFGMTIDALLVYIPQLTRMRDKLYVMKNKPEKVRESAILSGKSGAFIDYRYLNYYTLKVERDYEEICDKLTKAQLELDRINSTETISVDI